MKANDAPEKIHILPNAHDRWFEGDIPNGLPNGLFVEYVRTDAFIEKVYNWLKNYTFVDDNKNVNLPILLHDFLKDSRNF